MENELYRRLQKVIRERDTDILEPKRILELTIATIEAVKAHKIQSGFFANSDIQTIDQVSGVLRTCR